MTLRATVFTCFVLLAASTTPVLASPQDRMDASGEMLEMDVPPGAPLIFAGRTDNTAAGASIAYFSLPKRDEAGEPLSLWFIDVFVTPKPYQGKRAAYAAGRYLFDCSGRRASLQRGTLHATDGEIIATMDSPQPWKDVPDDDELDLAMDQVCDNHPLTADLAGVPAMLADAQKR